MEKIVLTLYLYLNFKFSLQNQSKSRKVFVGGVADSTTNEQIANYFAEFGEV